MFFFKKIRSLILCITLFFTLSFSFGQNYCNEWINYNNTYLKFPIVATGTYRINYTVLKNSLSAINISPDNPNEAADVYIKAELLKWHDDSYIREAYTSWETKHAKRTKKLPNGSKIEEDYSYTVPVHHPPKTIYTSTVRLRFEVFDSKTNKRVMARDELRLRDDSYQGQKGIFGRITKSFFNDLGKQIAQ